METDSNIVDLEVRILSGIHAGARAPIKSSQLIGSGLDVDIILVDEGIEERHAYINVTEHSWSMSSHCGEGNYGEPISVDLGETQSISHVALTVVPKEAAWPNLLTTHSTGIDGASTSVKAPPRMDWAQVRARAGRSMSNAPRKLRGTFTIAVVERFFRRPYAGITLILGVALFFIWQAIPSKLTSEIAPSNSVLLRPQQTTRLQESLASIAGAELEVKFPSHEEMRISGFVNNDDQYSELISKVSGFSPRPFISVYIDSEMKQNVNAWWRSEGFSGVTVEYRGAGLLSLSGILSNHDLEENLLNNLKRNFPMIRKIDNKLKTHAIIGNDFIATLESAGFKKLRGLWSAERLLVSLEELSPLELNRLEDEILKFNGKLGWNFPFSVIAKKAKRLSIESDKRYHIDSANLNTHDFDIQSASEGPVPWVILRNNDRILLGGEVAGYRLVQISPTEIIFDGARRVVIQR